MPPPFPPSKSTEIVTNSYEDYDLPENLSVYSKIYQNERKAYKLPKNYHFPSSPPKTSNPSYSFTFALEKEQADDTSTFFNEYFSRVRSRPHFDEPPVMLGGWIENMHYFYFLMFCFVLYLIIMIFCAVGSCDDVCCSCLAKKRREIKGDSIKDAVYSYRLHVNIIEHTHRNFFVSFGNGTWNGSPRLQPTNAKISNDCFYHLLGNDATKKSKTPGRKYKLPKK